MNKRRNATIYLRGKDGTWHPIAAREIKELPEGSTEESAERLHIPGLRDFTSTITRWYDDPDPLGGPLSVPPRGCDPRRN